MSDKTVLVLGGGIGGLVASNVLKSKLGRRVTVKLVDQKKSVSVSTLISVVNDRQKTTRTGTKRPWLVEEEGHRGL